jgi:CHAT domain-containing protein/tetratricopeptide (TPR) repeat protein
MTAQPLDRRGVDARQALDRADVLRANWTAASLREAIDLYDEAALFWTSIPDLAHAADATLKSGDVHFLICEYKQALERYRNAEELAEKSGDWLAQARALSGMGLVQSYIGNNELAQTQLTKALHIFEAHAADRSAAATNAYGEALSNLAEVNYSKGDFVKASKQLESALNRLQDNRDVEAKVHLFKSYIAGSIGELERALAEISKALQLYREINNKRGEWLALTAMGLPHSSNTDENHAIQLHREAIKIFRTIGDQHSEAIALNALGQVHQNLKDYSRAISYYESALKLYQNIGCLDGTSLSMFNVALAQHLSGESDQALINYESCLRLSRTAGKRRIEAYVLSEIATIYAAQGRHELAFKLYQESQQFYKSIGDFRGQAMALNGLGDFFFQIGKKREALDVYRQALPLSEKMGDNGILLATLYNLARANHALGFHDVALALIKRSLKLIEDVRANVGSPDFRASYFSGVRKHYDLCIDILMQLDRLRPGEGLAAEAFFVSENARARLLIDLLNESRANIREGVAKELVDHERRLRVLLQSQAEYLMNLSLSGNESAEVADQIAELKLEYQTVQAQLREKNPRLFAFEKFVPQHVERIQQALSDSDTMLLEYALGDEHSYLWAITSNSIQSYEMPPRKVIEDAAGELYNVVTARQGTGDQNHNDYQAKVEAADNVYPEKATNFSRMLLGPVAERLGRRRLVLVTEGALQYIPFEALPVPSAQTASPVATSTLIETNELVVLPSASTLIAIRGAQKDKGSAGKLVAIIADPVFDVSDERVQNNVLSPTSAKAAEQEQSAQQTSEKLTLARLTHASEESEAISAAAPSGTTIVANGFEASRETAMSPEVSRAQIIHFATHGFLDSKHPELSGIVLTTTERNGVRKNGLMALPDIYSLDLSAELIVLSACQTALGKDIKGEGLVGLTHSFLSAGANSVVASLWKVDDRATAALMGEFYEGMLQKGMTPSAALRSAKLKMMHDQQWSAPYYWAGFVLQGDYTNRITVDRHGWLRPALILLFLPILIAATVLILQKRKRRIPQDCSLKRNTTS